MKAAAHIALFCTAFLTLMPAANAEPSAAYTACRELVEKQAALHLKKADKVQHKYDARLQKIVRGALKDSANFASSDHQLLESIERIKRWHRITQARDAYVERAIERHLQLEKNDGSDLRCQNRSPTLYTFDNYLYHYERTLKLVEGDIEARIELEYIQPDEGLVIIAYNASTLTHEVKINRQGAIGGNIQFEPYWRGEYFRVMRAKAGTYNWHQINRKSGGYRSLYKLEKLDLKFEVVAGKLNYAGVFMFDVKSGGYYSASLKDRLVITLAALDQRYPDLLDQYEIANGLNPDDRFTEYYLSEKRLASAASSVDSSE